jgi:hypothetical protein
MNVHQRLVQQLVNAALVGPAAWPYSVRKKAFEEDYDTSSLLAQM